MGTNEFFYFYNYNSRNQATLTNATTATSTTTVIIADATVDDDGISCLSGMSELTISALSEM